MRRRIATCTALAIATVCLQLPSATASTAPPGPAIGECHAMTFDELSAKSDPDPAVDCSGRHQSMTTATFTLPSSMRRDDSEIPNRERYNCLPATAHRVGGWSTFALSIYDWSAFLPTQAQWDQGARWVRCDVVLFGNRSLQPLPAASSFGGALKRNQQLRNQSGRSSYARVPCTVRHQFHAKVAISMKTWSDDAAAQSFASRACHKRYPTRNFLYSWPRSIYTFRSGYRVVVCSPASTR